MNLHSRMKPINSGNMRIAVCDLSVGDLDILVLDDSSSKLFNELDDATDFFKKLGYSIDYISWMVIDGYVRERPVVTDKQGNLIM